ncbi:hypothetical protein [Butyrivibrio sp. XBB1001]|uniref:hypothetical protein n=1 Tax=Butyrivibrio sp. XBB1001 TaxID=1280682 RepID=UPI00047D18CF|nr:hypothetical protein [Butyrivibrio sp. XBB1001]
MKKLSLKLCLFIIPVLIYVGISVFVDAYNVFHVEDIRFTDITPNQNYIKTKYVLNNKDKFNAFILGSSRVANLPPDGLPQTTEDGKDLRWYNMTYAMGAPQENYQTVKSLIDGGVEIDELIIMIDEISMWKGISYERDQLIFVNYQTYEMSPLKFYYAYIKQKPVLRILPQIFEKIVGSREFEQKKELFYEYGVDIKNTDLSIGQDVRNLGSARSLEYTEKAGSIEALQNLVDICEARDIKLVVLTTPIYEETYREGVENGYLEFLKDVAKVTDFYNFSGLNEYTESSKYYFDESHFRPYVGNEMEKIVFGEEQPQGLFGIHVDSSNISEVIDELEEQLSN